MFNPSNFWGSLHAGEGQGWGLLFLFIKFAPRYTKNRGNPDKQREIYLFQHTLKVH